MDSKDANPPNIRLTYLEQFDIRNEVMGLSEPSGLALSHDRCALWTVSDDTKKIFQLTLDGKIRANGRSPIVVPVDDLEGITTGPSSESLLAVRETGNEIIHVRIGAEPAEISRHALHSMDGFDDISDHFEGKGSKKGLEGITCDTATGAIYVMKEAEPGLLIKISPELDKIQDAIVLDESNGFPPKIDFSGICFDQDRSCFWIVSDRAGSLYQFDWHDGVVQSAKLTFQAEDGTIGEVKKAEGVAIDATANRLYVVNDVENDDPDQTVYRRLFVYRLDDID